MANLRAELKAELEAAGLMGYHPGRVYAKAALLLGITAALVAGFVVAPSWALKIPLFVAGIVASIGFVMIGHESGHNAVSPNRFLNELLGYVAFPIFGGLSLPYWRYKHNVLHHSYTNVSGKDPDVKIYPFALNREQRAKGGFTGFVQRHQGFMFWPFTLFTTLAMRFDGVAFHFTIGRKVVSRRDRWLDVASLAAHYALWLAVPSYVFGFWPAFAFYLAWSLSAGLILAAIFIPAHMTMPLFRGYEDNFLLQLQTTQNLRTNRLFSYLLIGLDHQLEHHLFQRMSHLNVKKAAPIVRAFCARHGLPYHEQDWGEALRETTVRMDELPDYELMPLPPRIHRAPPRAVAPEEMAA